jgi:hypothetical protein
VAPRHSTETGVRGCHPTHAAEGTSHVRQITAEGQREEAGQDVEREASCEESEEDPGGESFKLPGGSTLRPVQCRRRPTPAPTARKAEPGPRTRRSDIRSRGRAVSTAIDSNVLTPTPSTSPTPASSHRVGALSAPAVLTSRLAATVVTNATVSDAASSTPSPASTSRSKNRRTTKRPGYSGSCHTRRMDERSASTHNQPLTGMPTVQPTPAVIAAEHVLRDLAGAFEGARIVPLGRPSSTGSGRHPQGSVAPWPLAR